MTRFNVPDMSCAHCRAAIERAVTAADPGARLAFDMETRTVDIVSALDSAALSRTLETEGYPGSVAD